MSDEWTKLCAVQDFPQDGKLGAKVGAWHILVLRHDDQYFAYNDCCTHQASRLSIGRLRRGAIMCPLHGARFEIKTGRCMGGSYSPLLSIAVREKDNFIEVAVPQRLPGPGENPTIRD